MAARGDGPDPHDPGKAPGPRIPDLRAGTIEEFLANLSLAARARPIPHRAKPPIRIQRTPPRNRLRPPESRGPPQLPMDTLSIAGPQSCAASRWAPGPYPQAQPWRAPRLGAR